MRNQIQMLHFLSENITSHELKSEGNKIYGRKLIHSRSFSNFTITFLKNNADQVSLSMQGVTKRYKDENEIIRALGSVAMIEDELYNAACHELNREHLKSEFESDSEYEVILGGLQHKKVIRFIKSFKLVDEFIKFYDEMVTRVANEDRTLSVYKN